MGKYISTDLGLVSSENANWLYQNGIISQEGHILSDLRKGVKSNWVELVSYLRLILDDIKTSIPDTPREIAVGMDELLTLAREGSIDISYKVKDEEFNYHANYPAVENIERRGKTVFVEKVKTKDKKDVDLDAVDFNF